MKPRNHPLYRAVASFLSQHLDPKRPVLLALSGGPDSVALFRALLRYRESRPFPLHLAHVNHGWRSDSAEEAGELENWAAMAMLPFHLKKLNCLPARNMEDHGRQARLQFFAELHVRHGFQGVVLGHHRDDQAETVIKRLMEGANLRALKGLALLRELNGVPIWRPLLSLRKKAVLEWLRLEQQPYFLDATNQDPRFLRARLRTTLLPGLAETFGKEVVAPLARLAKEAEELDAFMERHLRPIADTIATGPFGVLLDLRPYPTLSPYEIRCLIRVALERLGVSLVWDKVDAAVRFICGNSAKCQLETGEIVLFASRRQLWIQKKGVPGEERGWPEVIVEGE